MTSKLFEPIDIGTLTLRNRIVIPAMVSQYGESTGFVTQRLVDYYVERARNGLGLIIVEATCAAPGGRLAISQMSL